MRFGAKRVAIQVNIYNTLNINTPSSATPLSGVNFNIPGGITAPRFAEIGVTYNF